MGSTSIADAGRSRQSPILGWHESGFADVVEDRLHGVDIVDESHDPHRLLAHSRCSIADEPLVRRPALPALPGKRIAAIILCHHDPDVSTSVVDWLDINPAMKVISTPRTHVLLPHYGKLSYPAIVDAIIRMAGALGLSVVAEGVETPGQLRQIEGLSCNHVLGYRLSRPLPPEDCRHLLAASAFWVAPSRNVGNGDEAGGP